LRWSFDAALVARRKTLIDLEWFFPYSSNFAKNRNADAVGKSADRSSAKLLQILPVNRGKMPGRALPELSSHVYQEEWLGAASHSVISHQFWLPLLPAAYLQVHRSKLQAPADE
jgi:hypothetical protein